MNLNFASIKNPLGDFHTCSAAAHAIDGVYPTCSPVLVWRGDFLHAWFRWIRYIDGVCLAISSVNLWLTRGFSYMQFSSIVHTLLVAFVLLAVRYIRCIRYWWRLQLHYTRQIKRFRYLCYRNFKVLNKFEAL